MTFLKKINEKKSAMVLLTVFSALCVYHLLILTGIIPFHYVWGGRLESAEQMYRFESVSLMINVLLVVVVYRRFKYGMRSMAMAVFLWFFTALFMLNTLGNLLAESMLEKLIFSPVTALCAFLLFRLTIKN